MLLVRAGGRLVTVAITPVHHPGPADPDPWTGLLMADASEQRRGYGRRVAAPVTRGPRRDPVEEAEPVWPPGLARRSDEREARRV
ncbi:hypothetical protein TUE45_04161 [Streptomyces reticuli]|uniref:GNAT family N-acetyltransferase n=1 Tax=Streptomyces bangladeshensis TaxID=295352 RepID=A0ABP5N147_9ACTN|nr:hypothetical protein TUE45_04161 [Streptomyces reticuli]